MFRVLLLDCEVGPYTHVCMTGCVSGPGAGEHWCALPPLLIARSDVSSPLWSTRTCRRGSWRGSQTSRATALFFTAKVCAICGRVHRRAATPVPSSTARNGQFSYYLRCYFIRAIYTDAMDSRVVPLKRVPSRRPETVTVPCARPSCRREFERPLTRGRRKDYCSDECRRQVDAERRRTKARLHHYDQSTARLRADLATFSAGQSTDASRSVGEGAHTADAVRSLELELSRSQGVLKLADSNHPVTQQLTDLVHAVERQTSRH